MRPQVKHEENPELWREAETQERRKESGNKSTECHTQPKSLAVPSSSLKSCQWVTWIPLPPESDLRLRGATDLVGRLTASRRAGTLSSCGSLFNGCSLGIAEHSGILENVTGLLKCHAFFSPVTMTLGQYE